MRVSELSDKLGPYENKSNEELDKLVRDAERGFLFSGTAKNGRVLVDSEFGGDFKGAIGFLKEHGKDPAIANMDFNEFVESGKYHEYIASKRAAEANSTVAMNDKRAAPVAQSESAPVSSAPPVQKESPETTLSGSKPMDLSSGKWVRVDEDGTVHINAKKVLEKVCEVACETVSNGGLFGKMREKYQEFKGGFEDEGKMREYIENVSRRGDPGMGGVINDPKKQPVFQELSM